MKKSICIIFSLLITLTLFGCHLSNTATLSESQQEIIDNLWNNRQNWEEITGYVSGNGKCDSVSFGEYEGQLVFTAYRFGNGNTISSNTYYVYTNTIVKMDSIKASQFSLGLYSGVKWNEDSTKADLELIYLDYLNSK